MPPRVDFTAQRLFVDAPLAEGAAVELSKEQANYLLNVLRMRAGDALLVFNGRDGEWRATIADAGRRAATLAVGERTRPQPEASRIALCFAPLKQARLDYMIQKAVEMGAGLLVAVQTQRTQVQVKNAERVRANIIEAAEQCGVLAVPAYAGETKLEKLTQVPELAGAHVVFADEMAEVTDPARVLSGVPDGRTIAVLVGPEGGFSPEERRMILGWPNAHPISLGPRILRADTAAVAALAAVQMTIGDWR
ncbi:MAG: 16S rRNA (uracil(1498)-N(3))-methyltransferase [Beijerinckiaceae bacterium]